MGTPSEPRASGETAGLTSLPTDLQRDILSCVSRKTRGYSHALVCRDWAALAPSAQTSCACSVTSAEALRVAQELSGFPRLTSVDITAKNLPESFLSSLPESLQHLSVKGDAAWDEVTPMQGLPRLQSLRSLWAINHAIPGDAWPLSASLRHLDLGGLETSSLFRCTGCALALKRWIPKRTRRRRRRAVQGSGKGGVSFCLWSFWTAFQS